jgi:hypothetical protein
MTDRELIEAAAKAAGIELVAYTWDKGAPWGCHEGFTVAGEGPNEWNPLVDDGDALRLAVKLRMVAGYAGENHWFAGPTQTRGLMRESAERDGTQNENAAVRRAIVRAAAAMAVQGASDA